MRSTAYTIAHPSTEKLDLEFGNHLEQVQEHHATLPKALKASLTFQSIRVERWVEKLNSPYPLPNISWKRNRNAFAALLAHTVERKDFRDPFHRLPPDGRLPTLSGHHRIRIPHQS
ncbi:unnamed protein product, partial [Choristocarpus tenellus]